MNTPLEKNLPGPECGCKDSVERVNASQIKTFLDCPRKWGFDNLAGLARGSKATALGQRVHKVAEAFYMRGGPGFLSVDYTDREAGEIFVSALPHIPLDPSLPYATEEHVTVGHLWHGTKDLSHEDADGTVHLSDWKTTSDFRWAKKEEDLLTDIQAMLYASALFERNTALPVVKLNWYYMKTKGAIECRPVRAAVTRAHAFGILESYSDTAKKIIQHRTRKSVASTSEIEYCNLQLDANTAACRNYGGCPHIGVCAIKNPFVQLKRPNREEMNMGILDELKAKKQAAQLTQTPADTIPPGPMTGLNPPSH